MLLLVKLKDIIPNKILALSLFTHALMTSPTHHQKKAGQVKGVSCFKKKKIGIFILLWSSWLFVFKACSNEIPRECLDNGSLEGC